MSKEAAWKTMADVASILYKAGIIRHPSNLSKVVITVTNDAPTTVEVTEFARTDVVGTALNEITTAYDLVPRKEEDGE